MARQKLLRSIAYSTAVLLPVAMGIVEFYKAWGPLEVDAAAGGAFAAMLWIAVFQIGIYLAPRAAGWGLWGKLITLGLVLAGAGLVGVILAPGVTRYSTWIHFEDWPIWAAQYSVALLAFAAYLVVIAALMRSIVEPLRGTAPTNIAPDGIA